MLKPIINLKKPPNNLNIMVGNLDIIHFEQAYILAA